MYLDTQTLDKLSSVERVNAIARHLKSIPLAQRIGVMEIVQRGLEEPDAAALKYHWHLYARDSQLPPTGDWDTWMILAGRGFGKTRTGAEWIRPQSLPRTPIRGRVQPGWTCRPRRAHTPRSPVRHDRGRVRHHKHIRALEHAHIRTFQAKAHLAQRSFRPRLLIISLNLVGDWMRDTFDPRLSGT